MQSQVPTNVAVQYNHRSVDIPDNVTISIINMSTHWRYFTIYCYGVL